MQNNTELQREADEAVRVMKAGGIILYPTDTVWGLGCDATNAEAVERIYKLKRSENKKSMLMLCASADMVVRYVNKAPGIAFEVMELATSPLTAILPGAAGVAENLIPEERTLGVRIPDHEFCRRILRGAGAARGLDLGQHFGRGDARRTRRSVARDHRRRRFRRQSPLRGQAHEKGVVDHRLRRGRRSENHTRITHMAKTLETSIQKRFSDVDPFQHVNNVSQQMYFDVGKMEYYEKILGDEVLLGDLRIVTVSTSTSYIDQIRLHDRVRVTTTCEKIGNKSLTLFQRLLAGDRVCSESRSVMVAFDFSRQQSMPVPDAWRERLLAD